MKTKDRKKYIFSIIVVITILIIIFFTNKVILNKDINKEDFYQKVKTSEVNTQNSANDDNKKNTINDDKKESKIQNEIVNKKIESEDTNNIKEQILTNYKGYPVIAKLEIPKIELETYVISEYSEKALGISVTKFYGGNPNEVGNFCIAGHNYIIKNMFHDIKNLVSGDKIILTDLEGNRMEYKVSLVEKVKPYQTQCLSQKTNGKVEITLITCTTDSSKRIIVKAVKI